MTNRRVAPQLVYDTRDHPLAAGVRSVGGPARRLLFTADATELVLQMTPERRPGRIRLMGQVLDNGMPIGGVSVQLNGPDGPCVKATDDEGQFRVADVQKGSYRLEIGTLTQVLSVDALAVDLGGLL
jgi:hypothetical protein